MADIASPSNFNTVSTGTFYFDERNGKRPAARGLFSSAAGTITVTKIDGTAQVMPVVAGMNIFQHTRVTVNGGGLTLVWFE